MPNLFIQDKGHADHQMTEEENNYFNEKLASYGALRDTAHEEEKKIEPHRSNLAENLFGQLTGYMKGGSYARLIND